MNAKLSMILRILLGLILVVFGANKFLDFMPHMEMPEAAGNFMGAMMATGYMLKLVGATEVVIGLLLIAKKAVPFALMVLAPVALNMVLFHLFLAPAGIVPAAVVTLLTIVLIYDNWNSYKSLF
ncbi:MAG: DoxX protein [Flavobacteriales bacterium CG03_land_8_20_14_0_80_35_15]|nr:DoxX family membrane protein [Zetaproteobacteria bacterium]OIO08768.1 MAG: DoxX protein [Flavobacteriaceae bacterium CG1_02_35_72]PIV18168.1 MAG: DoxX protein [Flavobacteriales bacterium CG03_land_8_20_14_0_80_35_15]PIX07813.1 MAG: DoxX protein [Flavobacteriales bacterium CG_4_8_14_3_um_filter_35_10]PJA05263.1 MAG: DoxX protein [Flavobacteriales bacterium CG_4_10_14_0_2_um_filter_35_18]